MGRSSRHRPGPALASATMTAASYWRGVRSRLGWAVVAALLASSLIWLLTDVEHAVIGGIGCLVGTALLPEPWTHGGGRQDGAARPRAPR